ncbi:TPA: hypothetical protein EYP44_05395 [Candidatus Bathyarchaeota archaeon]|nr:hypothetical protein [Candidatus Bathyarchaeota archaeon]
MLTALDHALNTHTALALVTVGTLLSLSLTKTIALEGLWGRSIRAIRTALRRRPTEALLGLVVLSSLAASPPLIGLYVPPRDDPKMHSYYTWFIVSGNGYPPTRGRYAPHLLPTRRSVTR